MGSAKRPVNLRRGRTVDIVVTTPGTVSIDLVRGRRGSHLEVTAPPATEIRQRKKQRK
jgi:hypothetical protein